LFEYIKSQHRSKDESSDDTVSAAILKANSVQSNHVTVGKASLVI